MAPASNEREILTDDERIVVWACLTSRSLQVHASKMSSYPLVLSAREKLKDDDKIVIITTADQERERDRAIARVVELEKERDTLRAALKPFADRADYFDRTRRANGEAWPNDTVYVDTTSNEDASDERGSAIYVGQLRAARAALNDDQLLVPRAARSAS